MHFLDLDSFYTIYNRHYPNMTIQNVVDDIGSILYPIYPTETASFLRRANIWSAKTSYVFTSLVATLLLVRIHTAFSCGLKRWQNPSIFSLNS